MSLWWALRLWLQVVSNSLTSNLNTHRGTCNSWQQLEPTKCISWVHWGERSRQCTIKLRCALSCHKNSDTPNVNQVIAANKNDRTNYTRYMEWVLWQKVMKDTPFTVCRIFCWWVLLFLHSCSYVSSHMSHATALCFCSWRINVYIHVDTNPVHCNQ